MYRSTLTCIFNTNCHATLCTTTRTTPATSIPTITTTPRVLCPAVLAHTPRRYIRFSQPSRARISTERERKERETRVSVRMTRAHAPASTIGLSQACRLGAPLSPLPTSRAQGARSGDIKGGVPRWEGELAGRVP